MANPVTHTFFCHFFRRPVPVEFAIASQPPVTEPKLVVPSEPRIRFRSCHVWLSSHVKSRRVTLLHSNFTSNGQSRNCRGKGNCQLSIWLTLRFPHQLNRFPLFHCFRCFCRRVFLGACSCSCRRYPTRHPPLHLVQNLKNRFFPQERQKNHWEYHMGCNHISFTRGITTCSQPRGWGQNCSPGKGNAWATTGSAAGVLSFW